MKTANRKLTCGILFGWVVVVFTSSCGGGGGGGSSAPPMNLTLSTNAVTFKAAGPYATAPATQTITGTVSGVTTGTLYFKIVANNAIANSPNGLFTITNLLITGFSGQADVVPAIPSSIGAGSFKGSITVTACLNDPSCQTGQITVSPQTIAINYTIASGVDGSTITPHAVAANTPGTVILRGAGFTGTTSVDFGSMAATSMTVVNDSEIDAVYPALPAGTYPVTLSPGSTGYATSLVAVSPPAFTATAIPYPASVAPNYQESAVLEYDAPRTALFVLIPRGVSTDTTLLRYAYNGSAWGSPTQISMAGLVQVHLSPDGTHLLALIAPDGGHTSMAELDPITLTQTNITTVANSYAQQDPACGFAIANDGNAIVGNSEDSGFAFGINSRIFTPFSAGGGCDPVASGNGAIVARNISAFLASSEMVTSTSPQTGTGATADFAGDKFATAGVVENQSGQVIGTPATGVSGQLVNSAGTRLYGITPDPLTFQPTLVTFDLTTTSPGTTRFPQLGAPITLPGCAAGTCIETFYTLATTPDGATIFVASPNYVVVQPISP